MTSALSPWRSPFQSLRSFRREMDELLDRLFGGWKQGRTRWFPLTAENAPQIESSVEGNHLLLKADLPGVEPKNVKIMVEGNRLTSQGERKARNRSSRTGTTSIRR